MTTKKRREEMIEEMTHEEQIRLMWNEYADAVLEQEADVERKESEGRQPEVILAQIEITEEQYEDNHYDVHKPTAVENETRRLNALAAARLRRPPESREAKRLHAKWLREQLEALEVKA